MDRIAAGNNRPAKVNPKDLLDLNLFAFAQSVGIKGQDWTRSIGAGPQQALVHMLLTAVDPHHTMTYEDAFEKFLKLSLRLRETVQIAIFESFSHVMDSGITLPEFWANPGDHEKLKKPDEKTRYLGKLHLEQIMQKYMVKNFADFRNTMIKVRHLISEMGRIKIVQGGFTTSFEVEGLEEFLRKFVPLANKHRELYQEVHTFQVFPDGRIEFFEEGLSVYKDRDRDQLRAVMYQAMDRLGTIASDKLLNKEYPEAVALSKLLNTVKNFVDQDAKGGTLSLEYVNAQISECIGAFKADGVPAELLAVIQGLKPPEDLDETKDDSGKPPDHSIRSEDTEEEETFFTPPSRTKNSRKSGAIFQ